MSGGSPYILRSYNGDVLIYISSDTSVDDLRYMIDNIEKLRVLVENAMIAKKGRCGGGCGLWCYAYQEHDSGSGMGYSCSPLKNPEPDFVYSNNGGKGQIYAMINGHGNISKCNIGIPPEDERNSEYVGRRWLDDWKNFVR